MRKFLLGCVTGLLIALVVGLAWVRFGFVDPRADVPLNALEKAFAMPSLDASAGRRAPAGPGLGELEGGGIRTAARPPIAGSVALQSGDRPG
jgi:hypothetical protein